MPEGPKGVNRSESPPAARLRDTIARRKGADMSDESSRREEADLITQRTTVREALGTDATRPYVVEEDADLVGICERLGEAPGVDVVGVVDDARRLRGIIPVRLLLDELFLHVAPADFLNDLRAMEGVEEFGKLSRARSARDLMQPAVYVTMDESVRDAFGRMHERRLEGLLIVDREMHVVGYLSRLQLIQLWLQKHGREPGP
jgi:CBS domain-containing protein